ncbi:MAG TPA: isoleucine--tRNA ligase [Bryobacteraceae bacterium]|nr:isoleucine--tRNA ligase [Bryobacteraceae bacterium]
MDSPKSGPVTTADRSTFDPRKTVNLPKTAFPMKANLAQREPELLARWTADGLYEKIRAARAGRPQWILHDGPPYANGRIHLGTAFNKILKDFIVKLKTMEGYDSPYIPGWDCHGLPIELKVDSELGAKKAQMTAAQIRAECRSYAEKFIGIMTRDFKRLGVLGRWEDPYLTMSAHYEAVIAGAFVEFLDKGYVYKGLKPVNWCIRDRTALAEAEVDYENHTSPSIWVRFRLQSDPALIDPALAGRDVYGLIWTTTPWTIPANMAIAFHPRFEYVAVEVGTEVYIVALELLNVTAEKCGWGQPKVIAAFPGSRIEGAIFRHPFLERDSIGILADHVTLEQGTGAVHTAPGHGQEDYVIGQKYGIATYCPVDGSGRFFRAEGAPGVLPDELIGLTVWEANPVVIDILKRHGALLHTEDLEHSYPHCWRCHRPTIFRATEQWFIGMERNGLRQRALDSVKRVKWMPEWGEERMGNMIAMRPDWCISRQRVWGVPIIVFYCDACNETVTDRRVLDRVVAQFAESTADVWWQKSAEELAGPDAKCPKCGGSSLRKENDILDVWFDSGSSHLAVLTPENGLRWPSDLYLEGGDQYRGWFHSSLLVGVGLRGEAPYRQCATNGWALNQQGDIMSKSKGNAIEPEAVIKKFGADVLRLWAASVDFSEDVRISDTILERLSEAYRKIRNTFKYALGNLYDFDAARDAVPFSELPEIDQWILLRAEDLIRRCRAWYDEFAFHKVYRAIYDFTTTDLSAVYFDVLKDRLYTRAAESQARRSGQTAVWRLTWALVRLIAPLLPFTMEEVWGYFGKPAGAPESVHLAELPAPEEVTEGLAPEQRARLANWDRLMAVRGDVQKSLEKAREKKLIGASLEARVRISADGDVRPLLEQYAAELPALFIVSQVELGNPAPEITVEVERAEGDKCERCWKYTSEVGEDPAWPGLCRSCREAIGVTLK